LTPFRIPAWRKRAIDAKFNRKDRIANQAVRAMEKAMLEAIDLSVEASFNIGEFVEPDLSQMFIISDTFYKHIVEGALSAARDEEAAAVGKKRLAAKKIPGTGIPNDLRFLEKFFRDQEWQKSWKRIKKRSNALTERLRKAYVQKLRRKFRDLMPRVRDGKLSVGEAKRDMQQAWNASKARVDMIFRTESTKYFTEVQVKYYQNDPAIIGFLFDSIRDSSRSDICRTRHGLVYRPDTALLQKNSPPCHPNCRSHLIPLANTPENLKMLADPSRDPSRVKVAPLPRGWNK